MIPRVHGSALFERGETQILGVTTLEHAEHGAAARHALPGEAQRYMHKYVFPPFSTGETGRVGSPKRREVGHGALAAARCCRCCRRARSSPTRSARSPRRWAPTAPPRWARSAPRRCRCCRPVCRCKAPVAGIAMGLISGEVDGKTQYVALTDILGAEDAFGDMDFKVAGTKEFVTALQLDTKLDGIPAEVLAAALTQARDARLRDPRRDGRGHRRPRGDVARTPRGSSPSRSPSTRSARSSAPRAR